MFYLLLARTRPLTILCFFCPPEILDLGVRAVLIDQLFPIFRLFFQAKQEKQEKQEAFPKHGNSTEGKIFGRLRIPIFGKKNGKYGNAKIARFFSIN